MSNSSPGIFFADGGDTEIKDLSDVVMDINEEINGLFSNLATRKNIVNSLQEPFELAKNGELTLEFKLELISRLGLIPNDLNLLWQRLLEELSRFVGKKRKCAWGVFYQDEDKTSINVRAISYAEKFNLVGRGVPVRISERTRRSIEILELRSKLIIKQGEQFAKDCKWKFGFKN